MITLKTTIEVWKDFTFDSAHSLPHLEDGHKCRRLHGHTYRVRVYASGAVSANGMVVDYADIARAFEPIHRDLDHTFLNDVPGLAISTSEVLASYIFHRMNAVLPQIYKVKVRETCTAGAIYRGKRIDRPS